MKNYIKNGSRVLFDYVMSLIVFAIFIYLFITITKDNFGKWLPLYSALIFLFLFYIVYSEMKSTAIKEKRPQYGLNPYPLKGLVYGLIAAVPVAALVGIAALINTGNMYAERFKHVAINTVLGPMYFLIKCLNESVPGYAAGILLLPLTAMLGYLAGYYGVNIISRLKKQKVQEKGFTKSPWNPSNTEVKKTGKKKSIANKSSRGE